MDWHAMAAPWLQVEAETDAAHTPVLEALMARAGLTEGQRVVDIGPGGGVSLLAAAERVGPEGHVLGIEIAPPFAARARARVPAHVEVVEADAAHHAFAPGAADAAISLFGVMFFADPTAAFANIRKALAPGRDLTFVCWGPPQKNPWFSMPGRVAAEVLGPGPVFDPDASGPIALHDRDKIHRILGTAGWSVEIDTLDLHLTPMGTPEDVTALQSVIGAAALRMRAAENAGTLTEAQERAIQTGLRDGFEAMMQDGAVRVPAQVHVVMATA
jgi:SAM-dependent methyltransferase